MLKSGEESVESTPLTPPTPRSRWSHSRPRMLVFHSGLVWAMQFLLLTLLPLSAIARIHRLGQNKEVTVRKFVIKDSIEEKILKLQVPPPPRILCGAERFTIHGQYRI